MSNKKHAAAKKAQLVPPRGGGIDAAGEANDKGRRRDHLSNGSPPISSSPRLAQARVPPKNTAIAEPPPGAVASLGQIRPNVKSVHQNGHTDGSHATAINARGRAAANLRDESVAEIQISSDTYVSLPSGGKLSNKAVEYINAPASQFHVLYKILASPPKEDFSEQLEYLARHSLSNPKWVVTNIFVQKLHLLKSWIRDDQTFDEEHFKALDSEKSAEFKQFTQQWLRLKRTLTPLSPSIDDLPTAPMPSETPPQQTPAQKFFFVGKVFAHVPQHSGATKPGDKNGPRIARMVVMRSQTDSSLCLKVAIPGGRTESRRDTPATEAKHVAIFDPARAQRTGRYKFPSSQAEPSEGEIAVDVDQGQYLERGCQICFHQVYEIDHNIRVASIGKVADGSSMERFLTYVKGVKA